MSSSTWVSVHLRTIVVVLAVVLTITLLFLVYHSENIPKFGMSLLPKKSHTNSSDETPVEKSTNVILLIWMWPFDNKFDLNCDVYGITGCTMTVDRALYSKAHGVMFHHRNIAIDSLPKEPRPSFQKWVWFNMESPSNSAPIPTINNFFNLTCSYRRDSDVFTPYGSLMPVTNDEELFTRVPAKDKLVCWIVSNWNSRFKRVSFYNELEKHIEIKTYGRAFGDYISDEQYTQIMSSCKFYLSFENSVHKDYITEKFYLPLILGAVPVVLGPPRENYEVHAPGDAFIHVDDFASPKALAERLQHLHQHPDEYMNYFEWRNSFKAVTGRFGQEHACRTCHYLRAQSRYQSVHNLNKWYWES